MARFRFKRKRQYKKGKAKYRQQKLAVATVQKIARKVARAEDSRHIRWIVHQKLVVSGQGGEWNSTIESPLELQKRVLQPNLVGSQVLSDIGNLTVNDLPPTATSAGGNTIDPQRTMEYFVKAAECFLAFENNTFYPVRCRVEMCYIPNLNIRTDDLVDNLHAGIQTMHSGVNLKFSGMFNKFQRVVGTSSARSPVYQLLAAREFVLPSVKIAGILGAPLTTQIRKYITLKKYWKKPKKLLWKSYQQGALITGPQLCDNGNIIIQFMCDTTTPVSQGDLANPTGVRVWGTGGLKYYTKANEMDQHPVLS